MTFRLQQSIKKYLKNFFPDYIVDPKTNFFPDCISTNKQNNLKTFSFEDYMVDPKTFSFQVI